MTGSVASTHRDWTPLWEKAAARTTGRPAFSAVYTGPAWETAPSPTRPGLRVWKIAVLERRPGAGAEHWGHLFLILGDPASVVTIRPEGGVGADADRPELETLVPLPGAPLRIQIRARSPGTLPRLREFALEFQRHAVAVAVD